MRPYAKLGETAPCGCCQYRYRYPKTKKQARQEVKLEIKKELKKI